MSNFKYKVTVKEIKIYTINVEADSPNQAKEIALDRFENMSEGEKFYYRCGSDCELEALEL